MVGTYILEYIDSGMRGPVGPFCGAWNGGGGGRVAPCRRLSALTIGGVAVHGVQHTLGHASLATTRYVHVQPAKAVATIWPGRALAYNPGVRVLRLVPN